MTTSGGDGDDERRAHDGATAVWGRAKTGWGYALAAIGAAAMIGGVGLTAEPPRSGAVAVQFAPWTGVSDGVQRVDRAGGVVVGANGSGGLVWTIGPENDAEFVERLRAEGAWLILNEDAVFWSSVEG